MKRIFSLTLFGYLAITVSAIAQVPDASPSPGGVTEGVATPTLPKDVLSAALDSESDFIKKLPPEAKEFMESGGRVKEQGSQAIDFSDESPLGRQAEETSKRTADLLKSLAEEVETLRTKSVVDRASALATQSPRKVRIEGAKTVYNYRDNDVFEVRAAVEHVTDIQLEPGELLSAPPAAGDTVRWNLGAMQSGGGDAETTHIILKALDEDIETNIIITTNRRVYHLKARSGDFHMPAVSWNYPHDNKNDMNAALRRRSSEKLQLSFDDLDFDYSVKGKGYPWKPVAVFDDGKKTFLQMPATMAATEAPAFFVMGDEGEPTLVNYRVKGSYYIVDRLFDSAELRVGTEQKIEITSKRRVKRNFFERLFN